jgi:Putative Ig domain
MLFSPQKKRPATLFRASTLALVVAATLTSAPAMASAAALPTPTTAGPMVKLTNPYSPKVGHPYRHGVATTRETNSKMKNWQRANVNATGPQTLAFGGGVNGIGVTSGTPKVYLVFYGTQWGTQGTDAGGNLTFSTDTVGGAPQLQKMFKGLGTGNELWSGVMTQFCDGPLVALGATSCPAGAPHVGYPTGGNLAGVWFDNAAASPAAATPLQLGNEAVKAASHFGNTTPASNRFAQYVVLSPKGLNPDSYKTGGWTNKTGGSFNGQENADECSWIAPGSAGGAGNVAMGNGSYTEQATWSNDTNRCDLSHVIVTGGSTGNTITVTNPGAKTGVVGTATSQQISATDSASGQTLTYSATGLPTGLSISSTTGLISGTPSAGGTYSVLATATDTTAATGTASFTWTISGSGSCVGQKLGNPGFESGNTIWTASTGVIAQNGASEPARTGTWNAWMNGYGVSHTDSVTQSVTIPAGCLATLSYYVHVDTAETTTTTAYDNMTVRAGSTVLQTVSNLNKATGYQLKTVSLSAYAGQTISLSFTGVEDGSLQTSFVLDDTAVNLS